MEWSWRAILAREFIPLFGFIILMLFVENNTKIGRLEKKLLRNVVIIGIVDLIACELEYYTQTFAEASVLRTALTGLGYVMRPLLIYTLILVSYRKLRSPRNKLLLLIPFFVSCLCVSTAFFSPICYSFSPDNHFWRGPLGYVPHIIGIFYILVYVIISFKQSKRRSVPDYVIASFISLFVVLSMVFDIFDVLTDMVGGFMRIVIMLCTFFSYV